MAAESLLRRVVHGVESVVGGYKQPRAPSSWAAELLGVRLFRSGLDGELIVAGLRLNAHRLLVMMMKWMIDASRLSISNQQWTSTHVLGRPVCCSVLLSDAERVVSLKSTLLGVVRPQNRFLWDGFAEAFSSSTRTDLKKSGFALVPARQGQALYGTEARLDGLLDPRMFLQRLRFRRRVEGRCTIFMSLKAAKTSAEGCEKCSFTKRPGSSLQEQIQKCPKRV
ncbi:hypothetical protein IWZ00DRAFT_279447 [Phyllosticta capitalensis]